MKLTTPQAQPAPAKNFDLYYRGKKVEGFTGVTRAECIGEISTRMRTGCYLRYHFDIKPSENGK